MIRLKARPIFAFAVCLALGSVVLGQSADAPAYLNPDLSPEKRAADLVSRMTLEEKVLQMQNSAPAIERLKIPAYDWWNEALHGVARAGQATVFPQAIGLAATWDTELMGRIADTISTEVRAKYNQAMRDNNHSRYFGLTFWSPNINIFRDPRWGRGQETYGEDPYLTGKLAVSFIKGMQGNDPHYFKVIATAKHFAVHSGPEPSRHEFDVKPSERDLRDTYLPQFKMAIMEGKADSVMCAYNAVDGIPACANSELLDKYLKKDWGFSGYIVSDCGAINDIYRQNAHKYKPTAAEASAVAVKTGTDLTCGNEYRSLTDAVKSGLIAESEINTSLERLFVARFKLGMFDPPERVPFSKIPYSEVDSAAHRAIALEAARKSIVLLKNDNGVLPLKAAVKKIAVVGPSADDPVALLGNYNGFSQRHVTPLEGLEKAFAGKAEIHYALGATYTSQTNTVISSADLMPPAGSGHGVLAEYFDNAEFNGQPKLARAELRPLLQSGVTDAQVSAAFPNRGYSIRWTGVLRAPASGEYTLATGGFGIRLFVDDKEITPPAPAPGAGRGGPGRGAPAPIKAQLEGGHDYKLRVEYRFVPPPQPAPGRGPAPFFPGGNVQVSWLPPADGLLAQAVETIKNSDVAVVFAGLNPNLEGEEMRVNIPGFAGGDRTNLELPETQEKLIEAAVTTGKPVIVVLTSGSALSANFAAQRAAAVLELWYGGEEAGTAIAETLSGANNPAGRLPVTFYKSVDQLPPFDSYNMDGRTYRYFKGDALWGFGYGLSYSKFGYSGLKAARRGDSGSVSVRVKNDSARDGDEVAQVYLSWTGADAPIRKLAGFRRVHLKAGESREVQFEVVDLPKGKVQVSVGGGQPVAGVAHVDGAM